MMWYLYYPSETVYNKLNSFCYFFYETILLYSFMTHRQILLALWQKKKSDAEGAPSYWRQTNHISLSQECLHTQGALSNAGLQ